MKKLLLLLLFSYSIANAQLPTWVYGNQVNIGGRDTSVNAGLKLFINGRTTGKYLKNSGWGVSSFGNIESADVPWGGGFTLYDIRYVRDQRFLDSIGAVRAAFNSINLDWNNITGKPALLIAGNNLADVSNVATARTNLNVYSKTEADARFLQSFTESDPVWTAAAANYYTKTQADARYLQSFTETDPTVYAWAKAATKPAYAVAEITGLQTALDGKQNVLGFTPVPDTRTINGAPLSANITLTKTDVGLSNVPNTDATNPANITQSSSFRFVTDTEKSTWNAKQNSLGYTAENLSNKGVANGYAALGSDSKILAYQLPQVAINQTFTVNSQSAMLALSANQGDIAVRTDQNKAYILAFSGASTLANWIALPGVSNEADPIYTASVAYGITGTNVSNWNTAFGWGNHAGLYRPVSWVPSWTDVTGRPTALSAFTNDAGFITATTNALTNYYTITQSDARFAQLTGSEFTGNLTLPNGVFYRARRSTSNAVINVLGFDSGTDNLSMMISDDLLIRNTGAVTVMSLTNAGNLNTLGTITGTAISGTSGTFTAGVDISNGAYLQLAGTFTRLVRSGGLQIENNGFQWLFNDAGNFVAPGSISSWGATFQRPIYVATGNGGYAVSVGGSGGDYGSVGYNVNYTTTTSSYNYRVGDFASFIRFQSGGFQFFTAASGSGGASMSPINRYTMDVNGNNSWSGNGIFGGSLQVNSRSYLYLGNSDNTLFPYIRNMNTDGIGIYTNAGSALLEASAASGVTTNGRAFAAGSASLTGRMNADDYDMGSWRTLDWAGTVAQIGGINASQWQQIDFYTNGTLRGSFTNTDFVSNLPASINGGTAMTGGWNRTAQLIANYPALVFNSLNTRWAGIAYDGGSNLVVRVGATSNDIFGSGLSALLLNSSTGEATFAAGVVATSYTESSDIRQKLVHTTLTSADGIDAILYTFKPTGQLKWGYGAQQIQPILPMAVHEGDDGFYKVDYTTVHTYKIAQLEKRVAELEKKVGITDWLTTKVITMQIQLNDLTINQKSNRK